MDNRLCSLLKVIEEKYDINHGGCAFIAYLLARKFEEEGRRYEVCCAIGECRLSKDESEDMKRLVCIRGRIDGIDCRLYCGWWTPLHFFIRCDGIDYNRWNVGEYEVLDLTSAELLEIYSNGRWNGGFDVSAMDEIERMIMECDCFK